MNKFFTLFLLGIIILFNLGACSQLNSDFQTQSSENLEPNTIPNNINSQLPSSSSTTEIFTITDTEIFKITDIDLQHSTIMVGNSLDTDYEMQTRVFINEYTQIFVNGNLSDLEALSIGKQIELTYTGGVLESAPSQIISPLQIEVIE